MGKCKAKAIQIDLGTFRHNQAYSKTFVNLAYSELWYIQNPDISKTRNICEKHFVKTIAREGARDCEILICLLIYSNKLIYLQLITVLVYENSSPKSHEQDYL